MRQQRRIRGIGAAEHVIQHLGAIARAYGNVYVAQIAFGAKMAMRGSGAILNVSSIGAFGSFFRFSRKRSACTNCSGLVDAGKMIATRSSG